MLPRHEKALRVMIDALRTRAARPETSPAAREIALECAAATEYVLAERRVLREVAAASQPIVNPTEEQVAEATSRALLALDALEAFDREHGDAP